MINVKFDTKELMKTLNNTVSYSTGFTKGAQSARLDFNKELGFFVEQALNKYIDAKARANPESLHHIYEWGQTGNPSGRLFEFNLSTTQRLIKLSGRFLPSTSISPTSTEPFVNKAKIMEDRVTITIEPKDGDFLSFEDNGQRIFTKNSIVIDNPGGESVGGSFEKVVDDFFNNYLTLGLLKSSGIFDKLEYAKEYSDSFSQGTRVGESAGMSAGRKYLSIKGVNIQ
jgi:hypothetical protein